MRKANQQFNMLINTNNDWVKQFLKKKKETSLLSQPASACFVSSVFFFFSPLFNVQEDIVIIEL